jgi:hypothetical protein
MMICFKACRGLPEPHPIWQPHTAALIMITNPWINRITALVVLLAIYAAGYAGGRDQAVQAYKNHPACNTNLKP